MLINYGIKIVENSGGLNNQKMALLGLCIFAYEQGGKVVLPQEIVDLNAAYREESNLITLIDLFDLKAAHGFLERWNLVGLEEPDQLLSWSYCFRKCQETIRKLPQNGAFIKDFLSSFRANSILQDTAINAVSKIGKDTPALQLRIEADWIKHVERKKSEGSEHVYILDPEEIFRKCALTPELVNFRTLYVCCDRKSLIQDPEIIREAASRKFKIDILFKEDVIDANDIPISTVKNAILDFEICLRLNRYIGLTSSTFSNMFFRTRSAILGDVDPCHYTYNNNNSTLVRRKPMRF